MALSSPLLIISVLASHSRPTLCREASCEFTVKQMQEMSLSPSDAVYFGQLYGMSDHLTYTLGGAGFRAYKYLPWGPVIVKSEKGVDLPRELRHT